MTDKVVLIKEKLKAARDRQKSYADNRRKPLEFEVGDRVMLKVSPWKGVIRFGKKGKLAPRYVGPFEILERVGPVAYRLRLPEELSGIKVDKTLRFVEEPVENSDREVKRLKCSRMVVVKAKWLAVRYLVKVSWNSKCNFELTWVWEDYLKDKFDNQSIERDRLIGIGFVLDFVEFISFTFGDKEMILVIEAQLIESLFWDIVVCRKPMILAQLYVDVLSIIFRSGFSTSCKVFSSSLGGGSGSKGREGTHDVPISKEMELEEYLVLMSVGYEHVAMNLVSQLEPGRIKFKKNLLDRFYLKYRSSNTCVSDSSNSACSHYQNVSKQIAR
ncbi:hypothetical protein Tco_0366681 [Tanacetum coccineum]